MAGLERERDSAAGGDARSHGLIPAGWLKVQIIASSTAASKGGDGRQLLLTMEIVDGPDKGRCLRDRLNIRCASERAQAIARRVLAQLFVATGAPTSRNSHVLRFKPMLARIAIDPASDGYPARNVVKAYRALNDAPAPRRARID